MAMLLELDGLASRVGMNSSCYLGFNNHAGPGCFGLPNSTISRIYCNPQPGQARGVESLGVMRRLGSAFRYCEVFRCPPVRTLAAIQRPGSAFPP